METNAANELIKPYAKVVQKLEPNESYADFLLKLMKTELDNRQNTAQGKHIKDVRFPTIKTLDAFDTNQLEHISCIRELSSCDLIGKRQNVIMVGNPDSGKTHLATALGINACCPGFKCGFVLRARWQRSCLRRFRKADYQGLRNPLGNSIC